jgi:lysophospholipase L1-like esterase
LTVPVRHRGQGFPRILDVEIDRRTSWARKHIASVRQAYARAPFLSRYLPELEALLQREWTHLVDLDIACVDHWASWKKAAQIGDVNNWLAADGVHPTAEGHRAMARLLFKRLGLLDDHSPLCTLLAK